MFKVGAQVSVAGGLHNAFANAKKIGAECIQIFGASPRQWKVAMPAAEVLHKYESAKKESGVSPIFLHASYLVNLASGDNKLRHGSATNLADHLKIAQILKSAGLIFHPGSAKGLSKKEGIENVIKGMRRVLDRVPGKIDLIIENTAGGGNKLGADIDDIGKIVKGVSDKRVKVCLDTAHAFEAGELVKYDKKSLKAFVKRCDRAFGWKNVVCLHVNDSKTRAASHHDVHANIGKGEIGLEGFRALAGHEKFNKLPWLLEVPGFANAGPDKKNVNILKKIRQSI